MLLASGIDNSHVWDVYYTVITTAMAKPVSGNTGFNRCSKSIKAYFILSRCNTLSILPVMVPLVVSRVTGINTDGYGVTVCG